MCKKFYSKLSTILEKNEICFSIESSETFQQVGEAVRGTEQAFAGMDLKKCC